MRNRLRKWLNWDVYCDALILASKCDNQRLQQAIVMTWACNLNMPGDIRRLRSDSAFQNRIIDAVWQDRFICAIIKRYCIDAHPRVELICKVPWSEFPSVPMGNFRSPEILSWIKTNVRTQRHSFQVLEPIDDIGSIKQLKRLIYGGKHGRI